MRDHGIGGLVWSLNPTWDTGGILGGDWKTIDETKRQAYQPLLSAPIGVGASGAFGKARSFPRVLLHPEDTGGDPTGTAFSFRIFNNGPATLDLNHAELRYWFHVGDPTADLKPASVDGTQFGAGNVASDFVSVSDGYENCYLRVTFADTQPIESYRASGVVRIRFDKTAAATPTPADAT